jgi:hypothetical protein
MSRKVEDLTPETQKALDPAFDELNEKKIPFFVSSTLRTSGEQAAFYAQHREPLGVVNDLRVAAGLRKISASENTYTVTNCDGVKNKSVHQFGNAIDIVPMENGEPVWPPISDPRWREISGVMVKYGFRWGGDWNGDGRTRADGDDTEKLVDYPHYERRIA